MRKALYAVGGAFAICFTLFMLWASWENWGGAREWERTRQMLVAEGVPLERSGLAREPLPDDENMFAAPLLGSLFDFEVDVEPAGARELAEGAGGVRYRHPDVRERFKAMALPDDLEGHPGPDWRRGRRADLAAVRDALGLEGDAAVAVAGWVAGFGDDLAEIDGAAGRGDAQVPFQLGDGFLEAVSMRLPFMHELLAFQRFQAVRASAALATGDPGQARAALGGMLTASKGLMTHPTLIGFLAGQASLDYGLSVAWEGMESGAWRAEDLVWLAGELEKFDTLADLERALVHEMVVFQIAGIDHFRSAGFSESRELAQLIVASGEGSPFIGAMAAFVPDGIWDYNKAFGCRVAFEHAILPVRERRLPDADAFEREVGDRGRRNFFASLALPVTNAVVERAFLSSVALDLARVAAAVEYARTGAGEVPRSLADVVPGPVLGEVPDDLLRPGEKLKYAPGVHGDRYRVYSVGMDGTDDGGEVVVTESGAGWSRDLDRGDLAWGYELGGGGE